MQVNVSVCMATYNGSEYLMDQISSILNQLHHNDELIIVDDCSIDKTLSIINSFKDKRIKLYTNQKNLGHIATFERALNFASSEIIMLSDQDDLWIKNRLDILRNKMLEKRVNLITSKFHLIGKEASNLCNRQLFVKEKESSSFIKNIFNIFAGRRSYFGCSMALNKKLLQLALPFPSFIESHDIWLALVANVSRSNWHLEQPSLFRRIHDNNLTPNSPRPLKAIIYTRVIFFISILVILSRIIQFKIHLIFKRS
jgi:glycosyltransferase involved in cell wall biosynthesis